MRASRATDPLCAIAPFRVDYNPGAGEIRFSCLFPARKPPSLNHFIVYLEMDTYMLRMDR